jgi:cobalamin-dependent methionine synthase I
MLIIGESLNSAIPKVGQAVLARDNAFLSESARAQADAGAQMLDVGAATAGGNEPEDLAWMVESVQAAVNLPLMLDSPNPDALEAALKVHRGRPIVNSISGEPRKMERLIPLVAEHRCGTVLLCMDDQGIPKTAEARLRIARDLVDRMLQRGVKPEDLYVDFLVFSIGTDWNAAQVSLATLRLIRQELPNVHFICGLSNISFGMPAKSLLNSTFLAMAMGTGLDTILVNVRDPHVMATYWAGNVLSGNDPGCMSYLRAFRAGKLMTKKA